jgi:hypothetical protein
VSAVTQTRGTGSNHQEAGMAQAIFAATAARIEEWKADPAVLGVLHVGSKSRGHGDERSDDDLEVIVTEAAFERLAPAETSDVKIEGEGATRRILWDALVMPLSDLARKTDSIHDLDHWPYESAPILFERDARIRSAVAAAGTMRPAFRTARIRNGAIDTWTSLYRAVRTRERGHDAAARLLAIRAARALTRVLFALERRWVPLDHWLEQELRTLSDPTGAGPLLCAGLASSDPAPIGEALEGLSSRLEAEGVPTERAARNALFLTLIHPRNLAERSIHMLA